jgi:hypothetical protein
MDGNKADPRVTHISLEDIEIARSELPKHGPLSVSEGGHLKLARQQTWPSFEELLRDLEEFDADGHVPDKLAKPISVEPQIEGMPCGADMYPGPCSEMNALFCKMRHKNFEMSDGNEDQGTDNGPVFTTLSSSPDEEEENQEADAYSSHDDKSTITNMIFQMMFVSGETAEPSIDTTTLIEDITRQQVLEIVSFSYPMHLNLLANYDAAKPQHPTGHSSRIPLHLNR